MSRIFKSFAFLDRGWDVRTLENQSLRSVFLSLLAMLLLLGADLTYEAFAIFRNHRVNWPVAMNLLLFSIIGFRYARIIYRRLPQ
jgi:hypothetical protein